MRSTAREAKEYFEELLARNERLIAALNQQKGDVKRERLKAQKAYVTEVMTITHPAMMEQDQALLDKLSEALAGSGKKHDFVKSIRGAKAVSDAYQRTFDDLTEKHGSLEQLTELVRSAEGAFVAHWKAEEKVKPRIAHYNKLLAEVDAFNTTHEGKKQLNAEDIGYFSSFGFWKHVWASMTDSHYRQGRGLITAFDQLDCGGSITVIQGKRAEEQAFLDTFNAVLATKDAEKKALQKDKSDMQNAQAGIRTEEAIINNEHAYVMKVLENDDAFDRFVTAFIAQLTPSVVENRAKAQTYKRMEDGLEARIKAVQNASKQLETPLEKLRRACRTYQGANTQVDIDLEGIGGQFFDFVEKCSWQADEINKLQTAVRDYRPQEGAAADPTSLMVANIYMQAMLLQLSMNMQIDSDVFRSTLGTPNLSVLDKNGIDVGHIALSTGTQADMSKLQMDFGNVSVGNVDVNVSVPEISVAVPEILVSIPNISVPAADPVATTFPDVTPYTPPAPDFNSSF